MTDDQSWEQAFRVERRRKEIWKRIAQANCDLARDHEAENERLRALVTWALPYCPEVVPSMEGGEYAERYHEAEAVHARDL